MSRNCSASLSLVALTIVLATCPPCAATDAAAQRWGVVIGVGAYKDAGIPALRFARRDAEATYEFLVSPSGGGIPKENCIRLLDEQATLKEIRSALGTFLTRKAGRDDAVLIYFSGHGSNEADPSGEEVDGLAKYLVPHDADPDDLYATAMPMKDLEEITGRRIKARTVVMLLDSCYAGSAVTSAGALGRGFEKASGKGAAIADTFYQALLKGEGRVLLTACRPRQVAYELDQLGHGIFTYFLLEGLKGKADHDRDGSVTFDEVCRYVGESVPPKARERGGDQEPVKAGVQTGVVVLSRMSASTAGTGRVTAVTGPQITMDLGSDHGLALSDQVEIVRQSQAIARAVAIAVLADRSVAMLLDRVTVQEGDTVRRVSTASGTVPSAPPLAVATDPAPVVTRLLTPEDRRAVDEAVKQGDARYKEREFEGALRAYRDAQDLAPGDAALLRKVALCQVRLSQLGRAVKALERAAALAPADASVLNTYSVVLLKAGEKERALAAALELVKLKADDADYWETLGQAHRALGRKAEARAAFEKALELDPKLEDARDGLAAVR